VDGNEKPLRVVIVEDSHCYALRLRGRLTTIPEVEVVGAAESPALAIDLVKGTRPDVVLLDLHLRHGSGIGVLRYIRQAGINAKVIVMTSDPQTELRESCLSLGAHSFFDKVTLMQQLPAQLDSFRGNMLNA
jgi:two-component system OmpR family response regulator